MSFLIHDADSSLILLRDKLDKEFIVIYTKEVPVDQELSVVVTLQNVKIKESNLRDLAFTQVESYILVESKAPKRSIQWSKFDPVRLRVALKNGLFVIHNRLEDNLYKPRILATLKLGSLPGSVVSSGLLEGKQLASYVANEAKRYLEEL